jgi:signal transduction histidine kinase
MSFLDSLFDHTRLAPLGFCLTCVRGLLWLHGGADALIVLSYLSIPISLIWLLRRRNDRPYRWIGYMMVTFILFGAIAHGLAILTLWVPVYGIEGVAKALTAVGSLTAASLLWIMAPRLAAIKSTAQLTAVNEELSGLIIEREAKVGDLQETEQRLRRSNAALESVVSEYAEELRSAGAQLHKIFG